MANQFVEYVIAFVVASAAVGLVNRIRRPKVKIPKATRLDDFYREFGTVFSAGMLLADSGASDWIPSEVILSHEHLALIAGPDVDSILAGDLKVGNMTSYSFADARSAIIPLGDLSALTVKDEPRVHIAYSTASDRSGAFTLDEDDRAECDSIVGLINEVKAEDHG